MTYEGVEPMYELFTEPKQVKVIDGVIPAVADPELVHRSRS